MSDLNKMVQLKNEIKDLQKEIENRKEKLSETLKDIKEEKGTSFGPVDGVYYNIRRKGGKYFVCENDKPFGSWRKKNKEQ